VCFFKTAVLSTAKPSHEPMPACGCHRSLAIGPIPRWRSLYSISYNIISYLPKRRVYTETRTRNSAFVAWGFRSSIFRIFPDVPRSFPKVFPIQSPSTAIRRPSPPSPPWCRAVCQPVCALSARSSSSSGLKPSTTKLALRKSKHQLFTVEGIP